MRFLPLSMRPLVMVVPASPVSAGIKGATFGGITGNHYRRLSISGTLYPTRRETAGGE